MATKPCLFGKPMTGAERARRWRGMHPENKPKHARYVKKWKRLKRLNRAAQQESKEK